jgi:hypothetical protein
LPRNSISRNGENEANMTKWFAALRADRRVRELSHGFLLLALTGSSVGGVMGMVAVATRALGR